MDKQPDVKKIMQEIRFKITGKKDFPKDNYIDEMNTSLTFLNCNYDITNVDKFVSRKKLIGPIINKVREQIQREVNVSLRPSIAKQVEFNRQTMATLNSVFHEFEKRKERLEEINSKSITASRKCVQVENKLKEAVETLEQQTELFNRIDKKISAAENKIDAMTNKNLDLDYLEFENRYRGSEAKIKELQTCFVNYFWNCGLIVDIGPGRGEFLELLSEHGIPCIGAEPGEQMYKLCMDKKLNVVKSDGLVFIQQQKDESLGGVFMSHVIEHLNTDYLIELLKEIHKKLKKGAHAILITPNPASLTTFSQGFYIDPTHNKPIHPETAKFLLEHAGFKDIKIEFMCAPEEKDKFQMCGDQVIDHNFRKLNALLFSGGDYAAIAKK